MDNNIKFLKTGLIGFLQGRELPGLYRVSYQGGMITIWQPFHTDPFFAPVGQWRVRTLLKDLTGDELSIDWGQGWSVVGMHKLLKEVTELERGLKDEEEATTAGVDWAM